MYKLNTQCYRAAELGEAGDHAGGPAPGPLHLLHLLLNSNGKISKIYQPSSVGLGPAGANKALGWCISTWNRAARVANKNNNSSEIRISDTQRVFF